MQLQCAGAGLDLLDEGFRERGIALAGEAEVHGKGVGRAQHHLDVPGSRRTGRGVRSGRRPRAAAQHGGDAGHQRLLDLLRADEVDMRVEASRRDDLALARDHFGAGPITMSTAG